MAYKIRYVKNTKTGNIKQFDDRNAHILEVENMVECDKNGIPLGIAEAVMEQLEKRGVKVESNVVNNETEFISDVLLEKRKHDTYEFDDTKPLDVPDIPVMDYQTGKSLKIQNLKVNMTKKEMIEHLEEISGTPLSAKEKNNDKKWLAERIIEIEENEE